MAATLHRPSPATALTGSTGVATLENPAFQAFWLLRIGFTVAPILFGADKFGHVLVDWDKYLAPRIVDHLPWTAHQVMYGVGVIEIVAGLVVLLRPRFGGYLVAAWLGRIVVPGACFRAPAFPARNRSWGEAFRRRHQSAFGPPGPWWARLSRTTVP